MNLEMPIRTALAVVRSSGYRCMISRVSQKVIILDEPTSGLDKAVDASCQDQLESMKRNLTLS